jgi:hypothetical protein
MILDKNYIIKNAIPYNNDYNLIVIPKDTIFYIGDYKFSLYYPILIRVNKITKNITVVYDTSELNPLFKLDNNNLIKNEFSISGIDLLSIEFPIYQFEKQIIDEYVDNTISFEKEYSFDDKFYAIRVFYYDYNFNKYKEIHYSLSDINYDPNIPTVLLDVFQDENVIKIKIPQIYFTNKLISDKLKIIIYTSLGKLDIDIDQNDNSLIQVNFNIQEENDYYQYSQILTNIPTLFFKSLSTKIIGGSDGLSFEELKNRVIYDNYTIQVPITNMAMENTFKDKGFSLVKRLDNLTERIYDAISYITSKDKTKLSVVNSNININPDNIITSTILKHDDNRVVVLPNTHYKYNPDTNFSKPLTDSEVNGLYQKSKSDFIDELNNNIYLRNIYHLVLNPSDKYPKAISYDLISCNASNIVFEKENIYMSAQANVIDVKLEHLNLGCNNYKLSVGVLKSEDLKNIDENDFIIYLLIETKDGYKIGLKGNYIGDYENNLSIYEFIIETDYYLKDNTIGIINADYHTSYTGRHIVNLDTKCEIYFFVKNTYFPNVISDQSLVLQLVNNYYGDNYLPISKQSINILFGTKLDDVVDNVLTVNYNSEEYERYEIDIPLYYTTDIYEKDENGLLVYNIVNDNVVLNKLHSIGDPVLDEDNNQVYKHRIGDIKLDEFGNPIKITNPVISYNIEVMQIDLKYYQIEEFDILYIYQLLNNYYTYIKDIQKQILEFTIS